jgi:flagellar hook-associated protein 3 FlgL
MARITFNTMFGTVMGNFSNNQNYLNKLQEQISSGKRINRPSDDPIGFSKAMSYRNELASLAQRKLNMDNGMVYLTTLDTTHNQFTNVFKRASELAVQAASDTYTYQDRKFTLAEVSENLQEMVSLSNTKVGEDYIFSGTWVNERAYEVKNGKALYDTSAVAKNIPLSLFDNNFRDQNIEQGTLNVNQQPEVSRILPGSLTIPGLQEALPGVTDPDYEVDYVNGTITPLSDQAVAILSGTSTTVTNPNGNNTQIGSGNITFQYVYRNSRDLEGAVQREVDNGVTMQINTTPDAIFGREDGTDSFSAMIRLMEGLHENDGNVIGEGITALDAASERNLAQQAVEGARYNRMETVYNRNADLQTATTDAQSKVESVDIADALSKYSLADAVYTASLQAASKLLTTNLMNYL